MGMFNIQLYMVLATSRLLDHFRVVSAEIRWEGRYTPLKQFVYISVMLSALLTLKAQRLKFKT